ncbi:uncharacterized protein LOC128548325 isoform X2 [Mercenaria mercenaria]|uniref:uncharacterized protein LOC128548325 isoform X2 n=1 Tax=Mercenaria mercenaria TaxID=6596 RepID=UPI00234F6605|nr:uncharacterized protein LOC128548325 isoform X2 [Mercenaria mercenaria]
MTFKSYKVRESTEDLNSNGKYRFCPEKLVVVLLVFFVASTFALAVVVTVTVIKLNNENPPGTNSTRATTGMFNIISLNHSNINKDRNLLTRKYDLKYI